MKEQSLKDKKVVVIGGSSGIGLATAKAAADEGAKVIIVSANQQRIDSALQQLPAGSTGYAADMAQEAQIKNLFDTIGSFDHLAYTAGEHLQLGNLNDITIADAQKFFHVRYWGAFTSAKYAAPYINTGGSVTFTSGAAGKRPAAGWSVASSICMAMEGLTRALAVELAPLRVNLVTPGLVRTHLWDSMSEADRNGLYETMGNALLVKRIGEAEDIAKTYLYLMTQTYSTGQVVVVDGGGVLV